MEDTIEVAKVKLGTVITLEFGDREAILTKIAEPNKFKIEDWLDDEAEVYILDEAIEEDEPLHYSFEPVADLEAALAEDAKVFGVNKKLGHFLGRVVDSVEVEEPEDEEDAGGEG